VVGWSDDFDYRQLLASCRAIYRGARLIIADPDVNDPAPDGPTPGAGAFAAAIQAATGVPPFLSIGKPNRAIFQMALQGLGASPASSAIVGDRLDSDVCGGIQSGIGTIVVLTGITTPASLAQSDLRPDLVVRDLQELRLCWEKALEDKPSRKRRPSDAAAL
jgi:NagD protein